jgi:sortase A
MPMERIITERGIRQEPPTGKLRFLVPSAGVAVSSNHPSTSPSRFSRQRSRVALKVGEGLCLIMALACLGRVAVFYGGAKIFQTYASARFDWLLKHHTSKPTRSIEQAILGNLPKNGDGGTQNATPVAPHPAPPADRAISVGTVIGRMEIVRLGLSVMVVEGDNREILRKAVGHVPTSALPGDSGNVVLAGHRDTFFRSLRNIRKDDEITLTTPDGVYHYQVGGTEEVGPKDVQVLKASDRPTLTLITCYPFEFVGPAPERFVVEASQNDPAGSAADSATR